MHKLLLQISFICLSALLATAATGGTTESRDVVIVSSASKPALHSIATSISEKLISHQIDSALVDTDKSTLSILKNADLIISIGNSLTTRILEQLANKNIIAVTTTPITTAGDRNHFSQLIIRQPVCRQFRLIRVLSDAFKIVSVLTSTGNNSRQLQRCAHNNNLTLRHLVKQPHESLNTLINSALQADIVLAIPDRNIYNQKTVKSILLRSYRKRIPLIGFSKSFVNAGALAATYSTPEQIATQTSELVLKFFRTGKLLSEIQYPEYYEVTINKQVSKALQLDLPDADSVKDLLLREEAR